MSSVELQAAEASSNAQPPTILKAVGFIGGQITLLTALLFYFGWARTAAEAQYLGFDSSILQLSTSDYVLRSVDALFLPLTLLTAVLICVHIAHPRIVLWCRSRVAGRPGWLRIAVPAALIALPLAGWAATRPDPQWWQLAEPLSVTTGILLCLYLALLAQDLRHLDAHPAAGAAPLRATGQRREQQQPWWSTYRGALAIALVVLCLFWTIGRFANVVGNTVAADFISGIRQQDAITVTLLSKNDLRITDPAVHTTRFSDGGAFRFEYQGLVLFIRSGGNFFFLPLDWTYEHPRVIVIPDNDEVRVYYVRLLDASASPSTLSSGRGRHFTATLPKSRNPA